MLSYIYSEFFIIGSFRRKEFQGILDDKIEVGSIVKSLGEGNVLLLRNRGFIAVGETIEEVFHLSKNLIIACETQVSLSDFKIIVSDTCC